MKFVHVERWVDMTWFQRGNDEGQRNVLLFRFPIRVTLVNVVVEGIIQRLREMRLKPWRNVADSHMASVLGHIGHPVFPQSGGVASARAKLGTSRGELAVVGEIT